MIIVDVGACVGLFTDFCLNKYDNIEKIYLFEPLKINYDFLCEKYDGNEKIEIYNYAISDFTGRAPLFVKYEKETDKETGPYYVGNAGSSLKLKTNNIGQSSQDSAVREAIYHEAEDGPLIGIITDPVTGRAEWDKPEEVLKKMAVQENDIEYGPYGTLKIRGRTAFLINETTSVIRLANFLKWKEIKKADIVKIDTEGSEYDIIGDILTNNMIHKIDEIWFEDHENRISETAKFKDKRKAVLKEIREKEIVEKFVVQKDHLEYVPLQEVKFFKDIGE